MAAMEYAETHCWRRSGHFSEAGIGVGIGLGAGLAIGSGTYSKHGESRSKRADVFSEPARYALPATVILVMSGVSALAFLNLPSFVEMVADISSSGAQSASGSTLTSTVPDLFPALWWLAPVLAALIFAGGLRGYWQAEADEARLNELDGSTSNNHALGLRAMPSSVRLAALLLKQMRRSAGARPTCLHANMAFCNRGS